MLRVNFEQREIPASATLNKCREIFQCCPKTPCSFMHLKFFKLVLCFFSTGLFE